MLAICCAAMIESCLNLLGRSMFFEYGKRMCFGAQVIRRICISQAVTSIAIRYPSSTSGSLEPNLNAFFSSPAPRDRSGKSAVPRSGQKGKHRH